MKVTTITQRRYEPYLIPGLLRKITNYGRIAFGHYAERILRLDRYFNHLNNFFLSHSPLSLKRGFTTGDQ
jgi:hypothetical protein